MTDERLAEIEARLAAGMAGVEHLAALGRTAPPVVEWMDDLDECCEPAYENVRRALADIAVLLAEVKRLRGLEGEKSYLLDTKGRRIPVKIVSVTGW